MWSRKLLNRSNRDEDEDIVLSSEQLLRGDAFNLYDRSREVAPAWAYVNVLAHADLERLTALALHNHRPTKGPQSLLGYLATEVLSSVHRQSKEITWLQYAVLIPLELALLDHEIYSPRTGPELVALVIGALRHGYRPQRVAPSQPD
jgi:hypothetical protein